jgi:hypothetical protein
MADAVPEHGGSGAFHVRTERMKKHIGTLREAADRFNSIPNNRPNPPDAGESTAEVSAVLSSLVVSAAALSNMIDEIAELANIEQDAYGIVDNDAAGQFGGMGN